MPELKLYCHGFVSILFVSVPFVSVLFVSVLFVCVLFVCTICVCTICVCTICVCTICVCAIHIRVFVDARSGARCVQTAASGDLIYPNLVVLSYPLFEIHILSRAT